MDFTHLSLTAGLTDTVLTPRVPEKLPSDLTDKDLSASVAAELGRERDKERAASPHATHILLEAPRGRGLDLLRPWWQLRPGARGPLELSKDAEKLQRYMKYSVGNRGI